MKATEKEVFLSRGFVRRRELVAVGLSRKRIRRLVRLGELRLLAPDVLALPGAPAVGEDLRAAAAALDAVVSGRCAALQYGWEMLDAPDGVVVTVGRNRSRAAREGVEVRRSDLDPADVVQLDGLDVTSQPRTALDCCLELSQRDAVVLVDSALRARAFTVDELEARVAAMPESRNKRRVSAVLALCDPQSGSVLESLCRLLLVAAGLGPERTQLVVKFGGVVIGRVDFAWPSARLVVECDGFAFHSDRASYRSDRRRGNALVRASWRVLRFSWEDVVSSPEYVVACVRDLLGESVPEPVVTARAA